MSFVLSCLCVGRQHEVWEDWSIWRRERKLGRGGRGGRKDMAYVRVHVHVHCVTVGCVMNSFHLYMYCTCT